MPVVTGFGDARQWRLPMAAAPLSDTALLYRLALEAQKPGGCYHAVAEEGVSLKAIATAIGERLNLPVVSLEHDAAAAHFGWLMHFMETDMIASSAATQQRLGWHPTGPGLIENIRIWTIRRPDLRRFATDPADTRRRIGVSLLNDQISN